MLTKRCCEYMCTFSTRINHPIIRLVSIFVLCCKHAKMTLKVESPIPIIDETAIVISSNI